MTVVESVKLEETYMCPDHFLEVMENYDIRIVDLNPDEWFGWQNSADTVVFQVQGMPFSLAMEFARELAALRPDYCEMEEIGGHSVFCVSWN